MGSLTKICLAFLNPYQRRIRPSFPSQNSSVGFLLFSVFIASEALVYSIIGEVEEDSVLIRHVFAICLT